MTYKIICVDFDGTIVHHRFPAIGEALPHAFEVMKELKDAGHKLILWTCREDEGYKISKQYLSDAVNFCEENGVTFDSVNESIPEEDFRDNGLRRKPYAHVYIDDRNLGGFPGWIEVRRILLQGKED